MSLLAAIKEAKETANMKKNNKKKIVVQLPLETYHPIKPSLNPKCDDVERTSNTIHRSIMTEGLQGDQKDCCRLKLSRRPAFAREMGDTKLPACHYLMDRTLESFLLKLDDVFLALKRDVSDMDLALDVDSYKDIYEKLRAEILIAMDKLEFMTIPKEILEHQTEFFEKMKGLKTKLADLRWQYHTAIKDLGFHVPR